MMIYKEKTVKTMKRWQEPVQILVTALLLFYFFNHINMQRVEILFQNLQFSAALISFFLLFIVQLEYCHP